MAVGFSLHGELIVGMDVAEVFEVLQLFGSIGPDQECVIHIKESTCGLEGCLSECHIQKVFHAEVGNDR
jgi:hypothetical protein